MNMIITSECEECRYGRVEEYSKKAVKVICTKKDKTYFYGQCIPCDFKEKKDED